MRAFTFILSLLVAAAGLAAAGLRLGGAFDPVPPTPRDLAARTLGASDADVASAAAGAFRDVAPETGLQFDHDTGARGHFHIPEEMGPGVATFDMDGDGDLDVFVAGGGVVDGTEPAQASRLFRNDGCTFVDVTEAAGAGVPGPCMGVACADVDHDGDIDVLITRAGPNAFLRNRGDGTFEEVAARIGLADPGFGASAAFFDGDGDGWLDLYVTNYIVWDPAVPAPCRSPLGILDYCNPANFAPDPDRYFRNRGDGTFEDATEAAGFGGIAGNGLGVLAEDFDGDGHTDLYVANDQTPGFYWRNRGDGTFVEEGARRGAAFDRDGIAIAGMGVVGEDLDGDGDFDLLVTNIHNQSHLLLINDGSGFFEDASLGAGLPAWSRPATGFGVVLFDRDHDGGLDLFVTNGEVNVVNLMRVSDNPYAQPDHLAVLEGGRFRDVTAGAGVAHGDVGRGAAAADLDGDGDLDLVVGNNGGPVRLLRNEAGGEDAGGWMMVAAREHGRTAIGARVAFETSNGTILRTVRPQQSYLSSGDPRVHAGFGDATLDRIVVTWTDGRTTVVEQPTPRTVLTLDAPVESGS